MMSEVTGSSPRHLKIVPFSGTDYSPGECLLEQSGTVTQDPLGISTKLSLLFEYNEYAWVGIVLPGADRKVVTCRLFFDRDEAEPTELYAALTQDFSEKDLTMIKRVTVSFEIFRVCYEFTTDVVATASESSATWHLALSVPDKLVTIKHRRLPRIRLEKTERSTLPQINLVSAIPTESTQALVVSELGLNSIATDALVGEVSGECEIEFCTESRFKLKAEKLLRDGKLIFCLKFFTNEEFGRYFDIFRRFAYPSLVPKLDVGRKAVFDLYSRTQYFDGFTSGDAAPLNHEELLNTWASISSDDFRSNADFVAVDSSGNPIGASSTTLAFRDQQSEYWAFHQLCSTRSPDLLTSSGHLYIWRADFLSGLPNALKVVAWFRSDSRWLERIYVKFARQSSNNVRLHPVALIKGDAQIRTLKSSSNGTPELVTCNIGTATRVMSLGENLIAGIGPNYLNASGILNNVTFLDATEDKATIESVLGGLMRAVGTESAPFYVTLPDGSEIPFEGWRITPSDRFCIFGKDALIDFVASVEHSIAVTRKKAQR